MSDAENFVICGTDLAELKPTVELRYERRVHQFDRNSYDVLQQKWVASAKMADGGMWEEHRWRDVPIVTSPSTSQHLESAQTIPRSPSTTP